MDKDFIEIIDDYYLKCEEFKKIYEDMAELYEDEDNIEEWKILYNYKRTQRRLFNLIMLFKYKIDEMEQVLKLYESERDTQKTK